MSKISEVANFIESIAPLALQESYDNAGLIVGDGNTKITSVLLTIDVTEDVVDEAIELGANLILAHHPIVFSGLKRFNGNNYVERVVIKAIQNNIAIYAAHTNIDSVLLNGVNSKISQKLGLINTRILSPLKGKLTKLVVFVPESDAEKVRQAIFDAGAGQIGNYSSCSFNAKGQGSFQANEGANPYVGEVNKLHFEDEVRIETIVPNHLAGRVISAMIKAHPYEEVAYDSYALNNTWENAGAGMVGELEQEIDALEFLKRVKVEFNCGSIRHTKVIKEKIKKVALCGGAGSFLLNNAIKSKADVFITGDFKYHQFFDAENKIVIADIGHFESEQFTKDLFYELLTGKFSTFAVHFTNVNTNPIKYL